MPEEVARKKRKSITLHLTALAIDSNHEPVTLAAFQYREEHVYPHLLSKGLVVKKLQGPLARRIYAAPEAKKPEVEYVTGVGHGSYNLYTGYYGDIIWQVGHYRPDEVKGKIIHLLSCQAARELGPRFVEDGCRAFFGYDENFTFQVSEKDIFFECDSEIDRGFSDGLSAAEVYARVRKQYDRAIETLRAKGKLYTAATLEFDRDHLRCPSSGGADWGDTHARLR